jgi:hypothetical protein
MTLSKKLRRAICFAAVAASLAAAMAPAAGAQTTGNGDCQDPVTGGTIHNGRNKAYMTYNVGAPRGKRWTITVFSCKNGLITATSVDDPDPMYSTAPPNGRTIKPGSVPGAKPGGLYYRR